MKSYHARMKSYHARIGGAVLQVTLSGARWLSGRCDGEALKARVSAQPPEVAKNLYTKMTTPATDADTRLPM
jgi:hypothetical protein